MACLPANCRYGFERAASDRVTAGWKRQCSIATGYWRVR